MVKAHIVNHTHWDREWYFTSKDALVLSEQLFTEIIEELVAHPEASFVLDGQTSILDEYVSVRPDKLGEIKYLVKKNQLFIGPWYTQTDTFFTHGESILRNAMIGIFDSKKYGDYMPIGYLPDTFGFNAQMPVLIRHIGLDNIIFWRGIHLGDQVQSPYFKWCGLDENSEIYAVNMPQGYGTGMMLEPTSAYVDGRLDPAIDFIQTYSDSSEVLIPSGNDQLSIIPNFIQKLEKINRMGQHEYIASDYTAFLNYMKQIPDLQEYRGEFREPVLARVHKTIGSSRMNIKLVNNRLEQKLLKRIEPLLVIAKTCGISISEYLLMQIWKKVLEGQAHDSLAGCVSDTVAEDIMHRFKEAEEMADSVENTILKKVADDLNLDEQEILVVNTELFFYTGIKEIKVVAKDKLIHFPGYPDAVIVEETYIPPRNNIMVETPSGNQYIREPGYYVLKVRLNMSLPGLGYKVIRFDYGNLPLLQMVPNDEPIIENDYYKITFKERDVELTLPSGEKIASFITLEDCANAGDTYDFSPLKGDKPHYLKFKKASVKKTSSIESMELEGIYELPLALEDRLTDRNSGVLKVKLTIILDRSTDRIDCNLEVDNQIYSHRLRVLFHTGINSNTTIASLPFGYIARESGSQENWEETYSEKPVNIEPMMQSVSVSSPKRSFTLFTKGLKEYEHIDETIALTLLATTEQLGKPDLIYRPGRASGDTTKKGHVMIATENAQLIGKHQFSFAVFAGEHAFDEQETAIQERQYNQENMDYQRQSYNHFLYPLDNKIQTSSTSLSLEKELQVLELPEDYLVSACYPSYYRSGKFIVRVQNPTSQPRRLGMETLDNRHPEVVNAVEEVQNDSDFIIPAYGVLSIRLSF